MSRIPLDEMVRDLREDDISELRSYLAVALVPLQVMISDEKFPTEEDKREMVKKSLEEMGFVGSLVQSVELIPPERH